MRKRLLVMTPILLMLTVLGCRQGCGCTCLHGPHADILKIDNKLSIIILKPAFLGEILGAEWETRQVYYSFNRALDPNGASLGIVTANFYPMPRARGIIEVSGTDWEDLILPLYVMETHEGLSLRVNLRDGSVELKSSRRRTGDAAIVNADGTLRLE